MSSRIWLWVVVVLWLLPLSGCGLLAPVIGPVYETSTSSVSQTKEEGYLQFTNATGDHRILVDGKPIGTGSDFPSSKLFAVAPGPHMVEIIRGEVTILQEKVFIGAGSTREIAIR